MLPISESFEPLYELVYALLSLHPIKGIHYQREKKKKKETKANQSLDCPVCIKGFFPLIPPSTNPILFYIYFMYHFHMY